MDRYGDSPLPVQLVRTNAQYAVIAARITSEVIDFLRSNNAIIVIISLVYVFTNYQSSNGFRTQKISSAHQQDLLNISSFVQLKMFGDTSQCQVLEKFTSLLIPNLDTFLQGDELG